MMTIRATIFAFCVLSGCAYGQTTCGAHCESVPVPPNGSYYVTQLEGKPVIVDSTGVVTNVPTATVWGTLAYHTIDSGSYVTQGDRKLVLCPAGDSPDTFSGCHLTPGTTLDELMAAVFKSERESNESASQAYESLRKQCLSFLDQDLKSFREIRSELNSIGKHAAKKVGK